MSGLGGLKEADEGDNTGALAVSAVIHPDRKVWVVTVHGDIMTPGSIVGPSTVVHVYSMIIDGETGMMSDWGYGCEAVK